MNLKEITKPTRISYKDLCAFFNFQPIIGRTKQDEENKKNQINSFRSSYEGEIKYNEKKRIYTLVPKYTKKDLVKQQQLQELREKNLTVILHSGEEISVLPKKSITQTGFQDYVYYMAKHFHGTKKSEFYLMCLHPIAFYNRIFNNHYLHDEIDGFTYLVKTSMYSPNVLIAGRDLLFKRMGSHIDNALKVLEEKQYIDKWEYYVTNLGQKLDIWQVQPFIDYACKKMNCPTENIALEKDNKKYLELRDKAFQDSLRKGEIKGFEHFTNVDLYIKEKGFQIFNGKNINLSALQMNQEQLLDILDDYCKVFQKRVKNDFDNQTIIFSQDKKDIKVGYKFEEQVKECYLDFLTLDRSSFILPEQFQEQHYEDRYSIYMMKAIGNKGKVNRIISYREQCRKGNKKESELI